MTYAALALLVFLESAGLPLPGETALIAAAFAAARGSVSLPLVVMIAAISGILGDNLGYYLGRRFGRSWLDRRLRWVLVSASLERVDAFYARFGPAAVALARFVAGVRVLAAFTAGVAHMRWRTFLTYNILGATLWATVVGAFGFALGRGYGQLPRDVGHAAFIVIAAIGAALLLAWITRRALQTTRQRAPAGDPRTSARIGVPGWLGRVGGHTTAALLLGAGAALMFAKIAEDVVERESTTFDDTVRVWVGHLHHPVADRFLMLLTEVASAAVLLPLSATAALWLLRARRTGAAAVLLSPLLASALVVGAKQMVHRARPIGAFPSGDPTFSFPSGHSTAAAAVLLSLAYVLTRERIIGAWSIALASVLMLLVGFSRVYLDMHWATDVIGGWSVGIGIAAGSVVLYERARLAHEGGIG